MGRPYGDDLRRKFLCAYDEGEDTLEELAERFLVSVGWAKKISAQRNRTGQAERVPHRPGRKPHAGAEARQQILAWVESKPDLTLAERCMLAPAIVLMFVVGLYPQLISGMLQGTVMQLVGQVRY